MTAVYEKELSSFFHTMTGYIYIAFTLLVTGVLFVLYNLQYGLSEFGYVLGNTTWILLIMIPLITMRSFAEEQKQRTDQFLFTSRLRLTDIVAGKFLAILTVFSIPLLVMLTCPLVLSRYGRVSFRASYSCFLAYFFMGAACIAIGIFVSCLTDNPLVAAALSFGVLLINYLTGTAGTLVDSRSSTSFVCFLAVSVLVALIAHLIAHNVKLTCVTGLICVAACVILYMSKRTVFEGAFPAFLKNVSLFNRYYDFVDGILSIPHLVFYLSVCFLALFFSVQTLEKRHWS